MNKSTKYSYEAVIQQNYGQGWEDVSTYSTDSLFRNNQKSGSFYTTASGRRVERSLISHDLREYILMGYATRLIHRKTLKTTNLINI